MNHGGAFTETATAAGVAQAYVDFALGDLDRDGDADLVGVTATAVRYQLRQAGAYAAPTTAAAMGSGGTSVGLGDADGGRGIDVRALRVQPGRDDFIVLNGTPDPGPVQHLRVAR